MVVTREKSMGLVVSRRSSVGGCRSLEALGRSSAHKFRGGDCDRVLGCQRRTTNDRRPITISLCFLLAEQINRRRRRTRRLRRGRSRWSSWLRLFGRGFSLGGRPLLALLKFSRVQQRTPKRRVIARPRTLQPGLALEVGAHGLHLRIEIIQIMQRQRFRKHGQL